MSTLFDDLTGRRFGRLVVLGYAGRDDSARKKVLWLCRCDCGAEHVVRGEALRSDNTKSCGCLMRDMARERGSATLLDLTGQSFGRLTVLERSGTTRQGNARWLCRCECGTEKVVAGGELRKGATQSCGCLAREVRSARLTRHGQTNSPTWNSWQAMNIRCTYPCTNGYENYGGRGITVCDRWLPDGKVGNGFARFLADMGERPEGKTLDRIDPNGNYEPSNCRWATPLEQTHNQRIKKPA